MDNGDTSEEIYYSLLFSPLSNTIFTILNSS